MDMDAYLTVNEEARLKKLGLTSWESVAENGETDRGTEFHPVGRPDRRDTNS